MRSTEIFKKVTDISGYGKRLLKSRSRSHSIVRARAFFSIIGKAYGMSYPEIGALLDHHHTSVMCQIKSFKADTTIGAWLLELDDSIVDQYFKDLK